MELEGFEDDFEELQKAEEGDSSLLFCEGEESFEAED